MTDNGGSAGRKEHLGIALQMTKGLFTNTACFAKAIPHGEATRLPLASVIGIPFDCGTHEFRIGSRQGPDSIREQSRLLRAFNVTESGPQASPSAFLGLTDLGNVHCIPGDFEYSFSQIEQAVAGIHATGAMSISMGGDGAVTLPQLRAASKYHPGLVVLHFDAHTDTYDMQGFNTATTFTRAAEEGLIDTSRSFHIGARGTTFMPNVIDFGSSKGFNIVTFDQYYGRDLHWLSVIREKIGARPVYLCFDMDVFDPSVAPGVCTPEWGGLSALEGLKLLRSLAGLNFVAFDVNTVSPPHDHAGATAYLAATVMNEFCSLAVQTVLHFPGRFSPLMALAE